jgi:hypothetical protein
LIQRLGDANGRAVTASPPALFTGQASFALKRRHLNSGQRAMAVAMMYPTARHGGVREEGSSSATELDVSSGRLSMARTVLGESRAAAEEVMSGAKFLDTA